VPIHGGDAALHDDEHPIAHLSLAKDRLLRPERLHRASTGEELPLGIVHAAERRVGAQEVDRPVQMLLTEVLHARAEGMLVHLPKNAVFLACNRGCPRHAIEHRQLPERIFLGELLEIFAVNGNHIDATLNEVAAVSQLSLGENLVPSRGLLCGHELYDLIPLLVLQA